MNRLVFAVIIAAAALAYENPGAFAGELTVENNEGPTKIIVTAVARDETGANTEQQDPVEALDPGEVFSFEFDSITKPKLLKSIFEPGLAGPAALQSVQDFAVSGLRAQWSYPVLYRSSGDLEYLMVDADLDFIHANLPALVAGTVITTNAAGQDISGLFPPTVIFRDADTLLPVSNEMLTSEGIVVWNDTSVVPTASQWGLIILALLLLAGGTLLIRRRGLDRRPLPAA